VWRKNRNTPRRKFGFLLQGIGPQETTQRLVVMEVTFVHRDRNLRYRQGGGSGLKEENVMILTNDDVSTDREYHVVLVEHLPQIFVLPFQRAFGLLSL